MATSPFNPKPNPNQTFVPDKPKKEDNPFNPNPNPNQTPVPKGSGGSSNGNSGGGGSNRSGGSSSPFTPAQLTEQLYTPVNRSQAVKTNIGSPNANFSSINGEEKQVNQFGQRELLPFRDFTPNIKASSPASVQFAQLSGTAQRIPNNNYVSQVIGVSTENGTTTRTIQSRNFLTLEEQKQVNSLNPFGYNFVQEQRKEQEAKVPKIEKGQLYEEGFFNKLNYAKPTGQVVGASILRTGGRISEVPDLLVGVSSVFALSKDNKNKKALDYLGSSLSNVKSKETAINEKNKNIFGLSPFVSLTNVDVGIIGIGAGNVLAPVSAGSSEFLTGVGISFLSGEVAKQKNFNDLKPEVKKKIIDNYDQYKNLFVEAKAESRRGQKSAFTIPEGTPLIGGFGFEPSEFNVVGATSLLSGGSLTTNRVNEQIATREDKLNKFVYGATKDPLLSSFLVSQTRYEVVGGAFGDVFGSKGTNAFGSELNVLTTKAIKSTATKEGVNVLGQQLAKGTAKRISYKAGINSLFPQFVAGATENEINLFRQTNTENRKPTATEISLAGAFGGISSASVGVGLNYFETLSAVAPTKTGRVKANIGGKALYTIASFGSPEEPLGDLLSVTTQSKKQKIPFLSISGERGGTLTATKGYGTGKGGFLTSLTATNTNTNTNTNTKSSPFSFTNVFGITDTATETQTTTKKPKPFIDNFTFTDTNTKTNTDTPTDTIIDTQTQTDTLTGTLTATTTNTFQNFALPFLPDLNIPKGGSGKGGKERKAYFDELALSLNFGGLNLGGSKLKERIKIEEPKKAKRYRYGLF